MELSRRIWEHLKAVELRLIGFLTDFEYLGFSPFLLPFSLYFVECGHNKGLRKGLFKGFVAGY
jgi:hypothetical protein